MPLLICHLTLHKIIIFLLHFQVSLLQLFEVTGEIAKVVIVQIVGAKAWRRRWAVLICRGKAGILHGIDESGNHCLVHALPLGERVCVADGLDVLNAEIHVVGDGFKEVWLILYREILIGIATEDRQGVQRPVDLAGLPGLKGQSHSFGLGFGLGELHLQGIVVLGLVVQAGCSRNLADLVVKSVVQHSFLEVGTSLHDQILRVLNEIRRGLELLVVQRSDATQRGVCLSVDFLERLQLLFVFWQMVWQGELEVLLR